MLVVHEAIEIKSVCEGELGSVSVSLDCEVYMGFGLLMAE